MKKLILGLILFSACFREDVRIHFQVWGTSNTYKVTYIDKDNNIRSKDVSNGQFYQFVPYGPDTAVFVVENYGEGSMSAKVLQGANVLVSENTSNKEIIINYILP